MNMLIYIVLCYELLWLLRRYQRELGYRGAFEKLAEEEKIMVMLVICTQ